MKMLFCSDGSKQAENAVRFGALIAAACQAETSIMGIAETAKDEKPLVKALVREQEILKEHHLSPEMITKAGRPVTEIEKRTQEESYDLVVIGAVRHGECSSICMSARSYKIIESVVPPVLVVIGERSELRRILFCSGDSPPADSVIEFAGSLARSANAVVDVIYVAAEPPTMYANMLEVQDDAGRILASGSKLGRAVRHQKELLEQFGVFGKFHLRYGQVVPELLQEMQRTEYDLVVVGSAPSNDMVRQYVIGDVAREIVESAEIPVLVMRTQSTHLVERVSSFVTHLFRHPKATSDSAS